MPKSTMLHCDSCGELYHFTELQEFEHELLCDDCLYPEYEDDGQPDEWTEWQDVFGGDEYEYGTYGDYGDGEDW